MSQLPTVTSITPTWNQIVWDTCWKLMMPFDVLAHYRGNYFKDKYSLFFAEALMACTEREGDLDLLTGVWIYKPFALNSYLVIKISLNAL